MNILELIPAHIRSVGAYVPGKHIRKAQQESGLAVVKMASNENPFGPSPLAIEAIRATTASLNFYPDIDALELRAALATRHNLAPDQILVADGLM